MLRLQFRLADVFWATAAVATLCWLGARERGAPAGIILTGLLLTAAYGAHRSERGADLALSWYVAAWLWAMVNMTHTMTEDILCPISHHGPFYLTGEHLSDLLDSYVLYIALPMVCTLPAAPFLKRMRCSSVRGRRWLCAALVVGFVNASLLVAGLLTLYTVYRSRLGV